MSEIRFPLPDVGEGLTEAEIVQWHVAPGDRIALDQVFVEIETAKSLVYDAAWALDKAPAELPRAASMAKAYTTEALARVGVETIQLHGAIGYTDEYDAQLYFKRSKWARPAYGDANHHYERVAELGGLAWISN